MTKFQFYTILSAIWLASYKPDTWNLAIAIYFLFVSLVYLYKEVTDSAPD